MNHKYLGILFVFIVLLSACSKKAVLEPEPIPDKLGNGTVVEPGTVDLGDGEFVINLSTQEGLKEYLIGDWVFNNPYMSDILVTMSIDKDLGLNLSFDDNEDLETYLGTIDFSRIYAEENEAPDVVELNLNDSSIKGGRFFLNIARFTMKCWSCPYLPLMMTVQFLMSWALKAMSPHPRK